LEDPGVDGRIILELTLKKSVGVDADWIVLSRDGHMEADVCGKADKNLYLIHCGEFLD
jgi:hypothetical protein